jgi:hypothetical protein
MTKITCLSQAKAKAKERKGQEKDVGKKEVSSGNPL